MVMEESQDMMWDESMMGDMDGAVETESTGVKAVFQKYGILIGVAVVILAAVVVVVVIRIRKKRKAAKEEEDIDDEIS